MPPRRQRTAGAAEQSKLEPDELRDLIDKHNIEFLGSGFKWPHEHEDIFAKVKAIGSETFASYQSQRENDVLTIDQTKTRVRYLNERARHDFKGQANEQTWRLHTEPLIFNRFSAEIKWCAEHFSNSLAQSR